MLKSEIPLSISVQLCSINTYMHTYIGLSSVAICPLLPALHGNCTEEEVGASSLDTRMWPHIQRLLSDTQVMIAVCVCALWIRTDLSDIRMISQITFN